MPAFFKSMGVPQNYTRFRPLVTIATIAEWIYPVIRASARSPLKGFKMWTFLDLIVIFLLLILPNAANGQTASPLKPLAEMRSSERVYSVAWSPDGQFLAAATDGGVRIYTDMLQQVAFPAQLPNAPSDWQVAWKPDGKQLVSMGFYDSIPVIWNWDKNTHTLSLNTTLSPDNPDYNYLNLATWSPDGTKLAVEWMHQPEGFEGLLGVIEILNAQTWQIEQTLPDQFSFPTRALAWNPLTNAQIATGYYDCESQDSIPLCGIPTFYVADLNTGTILWKKEDWVAPFDVSWSPDGHRLALGGSEVFICDPLSGKLLHTWDIDGENVAEHLFLDWNTDGSRLLVANVSGLIEILNPETGELAFKLEKTLTVFEAVDDVDWNLSGDKVAIAANIDDGYTVEPGGIGIIAIWSTAQ